MLGEGGHWAPRAGSWEQAGPRCLAASVREVSPPPTPTAPDTGQGPGAPPRGPSSRLMWGGRRTCWAGRPSRRQSLALLLRTQTRVPGAGQVGRLTQRRCSRGGGGGDWQGRGLGVRGGKGRAGDAGRPDGGREYQKAIPRASKDRRPHNWFQQHLWLPMVGPKVAVGTN